MQKLQQDFDHIAVLSERESDIGGIYDGYLLNFVPAPCHRALEVGCGTATFTRQLAKRAGQVTAIDLSSEMIRVAGERSTLYPNIDFTVGNVLEMDLAPGQFDCIVLIATLHHMATEEALEKVKRWLTPGGVFILHDLLRPAGLLDRLADVVRLPINVAVRWFRTGRPWAEPEVRKAWAEHGKNERYLTKREVKAMRDRHLQEGDVKYHLLWRYTIVWRKPAAV
ncbi:MAG TPA: class I SAM-dependent methyltransferase [Blastocatellia bacterium]|nr:class I SAM-dependent methyltransferase [Blastocatellia bacterium]